MAGGTQALELIHILSSTLLFGTGLGSTFALWRAHRTNDARVIAAVAKGVVLADWVFTTPAVIIQPATGAALVMLLGYPWTTAWLVAALILYALVGACWIPVVWLQMRMRDLAQRAADTGAPLPSQYHRCYRAWFALGWPAFAGVLAIFWLMVFKPT
ncbi:MAG: DUF2269 family protein [Gammaproteobacteria bacterium]